MRGAVSRPTSPSGPLRADDSRAWTALVEAAHPPSLLVVIASRMGAALRARCTAEDVWQEALLHAWRDRDRASWPDVAAFRRWLLAIIDHRLHDLADEVGRKKRGGGAPDLAIDGVARADGGSTADPVYAGPVASTTPSRVVSDRETADAMGRALEALDADVRDVVRLRLFEDLTMEEVARRTGLGLSGARHRFRRGAEAFRRRLAELMGGGSSYGAEAS